MANYFELDLSDRIIHFRKYYDHKGMDQSCVYLIEEFRFNRERIIRILTLPAFGLKSFDDAIKILLANFYNQQRNCNFCN